MRRSNAAFRSIYAQTMPESPAAGFCRWGGRDPNWPPRIYLRTWLAQAGAKTLYIEPGSPWENGYCESFNSKLRDEFLNGEIFYSIKELRVPAERWRVHYNTVRPHSSLGYKPPAPDAWITEASKGHGKVESTNRFRLSHTPDYDCGGKLSISPAALH
jgi:putative transposase